MIEFPLFTLFTLSFLKLLNAEDDVEVFIKDTLVLLIVEFIPEFEYKTESEFVLTLFLLFIVLAGLADAKLMSRGLFE